MTPVDVMATCTARILAGSDQGAKSVGTGFFYGFPPAAPDAAASDTVLPVLVTNKHVLDGCSKAQIVLTVAATNAAKNAFGQAEGRTHEAFDIPVNAQTRIDHPLPDVDLCCLLVGPIFNALQSQGKTAHNLCLTQGYRVDTNLRRLMRTVETITMVGYPTGIWDATNNAPIIRKGITATHPLVGYEGRPEFVIDAACFPGSSGSPVFLFEDGMFRSGDNAYSPGTRIALLGILWGGPQFTVEGVLKSQPIPHNATAMPVTNIPMNLGFVIAADQLDAMGSVIHARGFT